MKGCSVLITAVPCAQISVIGQVLMGVECVSNAPLGETIANEMLGCSVLVGVITPDQVAVRGDVL